MISLLLILDYLENENILFLLSLLPEKRVGMLTLLSTSTIIYDNLYTYWLHNLTITPYSSSLCISRQELASLTIFNLVLYCEIPSILMYKHLHSLTIALKTNISSELIEQILLIQPHEVCIYQPSEYFLEKMSHSGYQCTFASLASSSLRLTFKKI